MTNPEFILMLREMADYLERIEREHPGKVPECCIWQSFSNRWEFQALSKQQMRAYAGIFGGHLTKELDGDYLKLVKNLKTCGIELWAPRNLVCERVVTGTRLVKKEVPTSYDVREVKEEIIEWHCPESLLA